MKLRKLIAFMGSFVLAAFVFAEKVSFIDNTGARVTVDLPSEVASIINKNYDEIQSAITSKGVSAADIRSVSDKVNEAYGKLSDYGLNTLNPITDAQDGMNELSEGIVDVVPDSQMQQNVWAKAWLGELLHVGGGLNAGVSFMSISSLLDAADSIGIDTSSIPSSIPFPTITADLRVSLPIIPLDLGATLSLLDTRKISGISDVFTDFALDFFNVGFDFRYPLIKEGPLNSILSLGGGFYYSRGGLSVDGDKASVSLNYKASTFKVNAQYSLSLACFVPFVGARVAFTQADADWEIAVNWKRLYKNESAWISMAQDWGVLPTEFSGGSSCSFTDSIRPQLYGGIGLDLFHFNLTASACFDFNTLIPSVALSARLCF